MMKIVLLTETQKPPPPKHATQAMKYEYYIIITYNNVTYVNMIW